MITMNCICILEIEYVRYVDVSLRDWAYNLTKNKAQAK